MAGAFLTLLAWGLMPAGSARAGCLHERPSAAHFEALVLAGAMSEVGDPGASNAAPGRIPTCTGPTCSRGPAAPPASTWSATAAHDSWAYLVETLDPAISPPSPLPPDAVPALPADRGPSIFHPPRVSSR